MSGGGRGGGGGVKFHFWNNLTPPPPPPPPPHKFHFLKKFTTRFTLSGTTFIRVWPKKDPSKTPFYCSFYCCYSCCCDYYYHHHYHHHHHHLIRIFEQDGIIWHKKFVFYRKFLLHKIFKELIPEISNFTVKTTRCKS